MSKESKRAARNNEDDSSTPAAATNDADNSRRVEELLDNKLAPLDEHRQRTDSWMKEITSQVARLAGDSEGDERRAGAIDKRIADLESRIQSLLTLTEVMSLDKNPFADRGGNAPTTPAIPTPRDAAPATTDAPAPSNNAGEPDPSTPGPSPTPHAPSPSPNATSAPEPDHESDQPGLADDERIRNALSPSRRSQVAAALDDAPVAPTNKPGTPALPRPGSVHPNDAFAEPADNPFVDAPATRPAPLPAGVHGTRNAQAHDDHPAGTNDANETRRRLMILQWAELLSHELPKLDLGSFLGFYVETGWVDRPLAACVRNLAWQLHQAAGHDRMEPTHGLPELHARSILMLSHLSDAPVPSADARRIVEDAREAMGGSPILVEQPA